MRVGISRRGFVAAAGAACYASAAGASDGVRNEQKPRSTLARIITTCQNSRGHATVEGNRENMLALFDRAVKQTPDLVCFPEGFIGRGNDVWKPETVPGPTTDAFARRAKSHRCYIICPIPTARDGRDWNSAVVINRAGQILGAYGQNTQPSVKTCPLRDLRVAEKEDLGRGAVVKPSPEGRGA